jgi:hypothetical protein
MQQQPCFPRNQCLPFNYLIDCDFVQKQIDLLSGDNGGHWLITFNVSRVFFRKILKERKKERR